MLARLLIGLSCLLVSASLISQTLTSTVDRNQINANQTLTLTVTYDGNTRTDALDLNAIRQDFEVLSSSSGTNVQIINNQQSRATTWTLMLLPRTTGNLVIPSFNLGNIYSDAIQIEVLESGQATNQNDPLSVALTVDRDQVRVGEQVLVKVKLRAQPNLSNLSGEELRIDGVDIQLVDQQNYAEVVEGVNWQVIEWTYALFPQSSEPIAIPRQMFTAILPGTQRRSIFDSFASRGERVAARSEPSVVNVESAVDIADADWFPASNVTISSSWVSDPSNLRVGEPLTRVVEVSAESQLAAAIPPLDTSEPVDYKVYRDQPVLEDTPAENGISGVRRESTAVVPSQEGPIEFPEQIIKWWDINSQQWREALLPAESYTVLPALTDNSLSPPTHLENAPVASFDQNMLAPSPQQTTNAQSDPLWKWATIALLLIVALQTLMLIRMRSSTPSTSTTPKTDQNTESEKQAWDQLTTALKSENAGDIRVALIQWSKFRWPKEKAHTLNALANKSESSEFKKAISGLDMILFRGSTGKPSSSALKEELKKLRNASSKPATESALAPLYPQSL